MKKRLLWFLPVLMAAMVVVPTTVLAAVTYYIPVVVSNSGAGSDYDILPIIESISNESLADQGYINASGTDTRVDIGAEIKHMVADDKVAFAAEDVNHGVTYNFQYTMGNDSIDAFAIIPGYSQTYGLEEQYISSDDGYVKIYDTTWEAQTFTTSAGFNYSINKVQLKLFRLGSPGTATVAIKATSGGLPTGSNLTSGTIDGNSLTTDTSGVWYDITFTPYTLSDNTKYAIELSAPSGTVDVDEVRWSADFSSPAYSGGDWCSSSDSGDNWTEHADTDAMFKVYRNAESSIYRADTPDMELVNNFTIEQKGYVDTSAGSNKNLVYKDGAFRTYVSAGESITSDIATSTLKTQSSNDTDFTMDTTGYRAAQKISGFTGTITEVQWYMRKAGTGSSGTLTVNVRRVSDDSIIGTVDTKDVSSLTTSNAWIVFNTTSVAVSTATDIRITCELTGVGTVYFRYQNADVSTWGIRSRYTTSWTDYSTDDATFQITYYDFSAPKTVTATGITSGVRKVITRTYLFGSLPPENFLTIEVYDENNVLLDSDAVALEGAIVDDNDSPWYWMQGNSMPYMDYLKITTAIGGTSLKAHYEPTTMIIGDQLPDETDNHYDATFSWGFNPETVNVSHGALQILNLQQMTEEEETDTLQLISDVPQEPGGFYDAENYGALPGSSVINELATAGQIPLKLFWVPMLFMIVIAIGLVVYGKTRHIFGVAIGSCIVLGIFCGIGMLPWWVMLPYVILSVTMIVSEKTYGF